MARTLALACLCSLLAAQMALAAVPPATFDKALIVADITKCPKKNKEWDPKVFDASVLASMPTALSEAGVSQKCQDEALERLAVCFTDGSLQVQQGCCSKDCAGNITASIKGGCFPTYVEAICTSEDPQTESVRLGLFHAAKRCSNYPVSCAGVMPKNATAKANATKANMTEEEPATAAAAAPAAENATAPEPAAAPAPKSGASALVQASANVAMAIIAAVMLLAATAV